MSAKILHFPRREPRTETTDRGSDPATIVSLKAHRARARVRRTLNGVFFASTGPDPEAPSAA